MIDANAPLPRILTNFYCLLAWRYRSQWSQ
ncbi:hypothetical protein N483_08870 [Pseudoalteromonas luteoviolacea NCIMB 1944]|uniref:Uncharacterized protein n=1 Tax=Pseudoalteromonas luteoviolacea (strain 2ta16) TaxID=1353533 RepID=V4HV75_PSEL2|nr:hypothetical protein PL2TA16_00740 [Pseudoalteromonas luteoviolacea 2ta16]KZN43396.1 hypothetical protein N483_08870 [Pseudoalteromonas luteoviolacea NCIMB 1944]